MNNGFVIYPTNKKQMKYIKKERSIEESCIKKYDDVQKYEFVAPHTDNENNIFSDEVMF